MNEVLGALKSPLWWFSAVVVAILVNLLSSYLRDGTDRAIAYVRKKLPQPKGIDYTQSNAAFLDKLRQNEGLRRFLFEAETRARLLSLELMLLAMFCTALYVYALPMKSGLIAQLMQPVQQVSCLALFYFSSERYSFAHALERLLLQVERGREHPDEA